LTESTPRPEPDEEPGGERQTLEIPAQTPYFHALERDRYQRQRQIRAIQEHTGRKLICFVSSVWAEITPDCIPPFGDLLEDIEPQDDLDLLLNTPGGDIDAAEKLVMMCRSRCRSFRVIVPERAKSAGTMMACAADTIVMGYASELGPIDPQVIVTDARGERVSRPAQSYLDGLEHIKETAKREGELSQAFFPLLDRLDPALLDFCRKSIQRSEEFARKWLELYQYAGDAERAAEIARALGDVERFRSHGVAIDAAQARDLGLKIEELDPKDRLWQMVWRLFCECDLVLRQAQLRYVFEGERASILW
jgi:hypothetical protein